MKLQSIILDDEQHGINTLLWQIKQYNLNVEVLKTFTSPLQAIQYLKTTKIDLIFLDIEMPELNGFEFLKKIPNPNFDIVFTTAYDEFAIQAFKTSAIDYLLKPIEKDDLINAIQKATNKKKPVVLPEQLDILFQNLFQKNTVKERIAFPTQEGVFFIKIAEILYCISDSNYTYIYCDNNKKILVSKTLKEICSTLENHSFLRIHNSHLINTNKIEKYVRGDGGYVVMDDKKSLSVSRSRKDILLKTLAN